MHEIILTPHLNYLLSSKKYNNDVSFKSKKPVCFAFQTLLQKKENTLRIFKQLS